MMMSIHLANSLRDRCKYFQAGAVIVFALLVITIGAEDKEWRVVWEDEFDGTELDLTRWGFDLGTGCHLGPDLCGWGNQELQFYTNCSKNVAVKNGRLTITARKEDLQDRHYTSVRLTTHRKAEWKFGKVEVRAKMPNGRGLWPAIWMLPAEEKFGKWPNGGEIDIMELVGHEPNVVHFTAHFGNAWNDKGQKGRNYTLTRRTFANKFHVFGIEWAEDVVKWLLDGKHMLSLRRKDVEPKFKFPFNEKFYLLLNVAVGGNWPGSPDNATKFPAKMEVDYVRVYQLP